MDILFCLHVCTYTHKHTYNAAWVQSACEELRCPITMSVMVDAVVTCDGHSYERAAIIQWLRRHASVCI